MKTTSQVAIAGIVIVVLIVGILGFMTLGGIGVSIQVPPNNSPISSSSSSNYNQQTTLSSSSVSTQTGTINHETFASSISSSSSTSRSTTTSITGPLLNVSAIMENGTGLTGIRVTLQQNGTTIANGQTPAVFPIMEGKNYSVYVSDYNNTYFNHWADCTSTREHFIIANKSNVNLTAIYTPTAQPPPDCGNPNDTVTVSSHSLNGTVITGEYVNIRLNGNIIEGGYTPVTFHGLQPGLEYEVVAYWSGNYYFRHYSDGNLTRYHFVSPGATPIKLDALYDYIPPGQTAVLNVVAELPNGTVIGGDSVVNGSIVALPGMWMTVTAAGQSKPLTGGYTNSSMVPFVLFKGESYNISMSTSFGGYNFSHWQDTGNKNPQRIFTLTANYTNKIAIYTYNSAQANSRTTINSGSLSIQPSRVLMAELISITTITITTTVFFTISPLVSLPYLRRNSVYHSRWR